jgi:hypothetical protein
MVGFFDGKTIKAKVKEALCEERITPPLNATGTSVEDGGLIRISSLAGMCAREEILCSRLNRVRKSLISADLSAIFEHGNGLHWCLQNRVLVRSESIVGRWLCGNCGSCHGGQAEWELPVEKEFKDSQVFRPEVCPMCGSKLSSDNSLYQEQWLVDRKERWSGHPDGFIRDRMALGLGVLEGKSINPRQAWEVRNCPKLDHVVQAQSYMVATGCRWALIFYWAKDGSGMVSLIPHVIEYDEVHAETIMNMVRDIWKGVREVDSLLPERICVTPDSKRALLCSTSEECFQE